MQRCLLLLAFAVALCGRAHAEPLSAEQLQQPIQWIATGDALWDEFAQATFNRLASRGIDPETLVTNFELNDSPSQLEADVLKEMEPRFLNDSRYWELCIWSLESRFWQDSLQTESDAQERLGLKDIKQLPRVSRHPWPYYKDIGPYIEHLRSLANVGDASPGAVYTVFQHDCARLFWEQNQEPATLRKTGSKPRDAGFLESLVDRANTATFASELSSERQEKFAELLYWMDAHNGGSGLLRLWCAAGLMELGRFEEAQPILLDISNESLRPTYPFPLSHVAEQVLPGGDLSLENIGQLSSGPEALGERGGLGALLAGMVLSKSQLFPPFPFGTKVINGSQYRKMLAAGTDTKVLNVLHATYCRAIADTVLDRYGFSVEGFLDSIDELAALRMMHVAGGLSERQRWELSAVQSKVGELRGSLARSLQEADDIDLPGIDTSGKSWDEVFDLATSSFYGYLRHYVVAAHHADSMRSLGKEALDLQRFDYGLTKWALKPETVKRLGRRNNSGIMYGKDNMLRFDYVTRTWGASKRMLRRVSRRTENSIAETASSLKEASKQ